MIGQNLESDPDAADGRSSCEDQLAVPDADALTVERFAGV
jgi:hypothetical protein